MKSVVRIAGMHCDGCVKRITGALSRVPGVTSAHVTLDPSQARIEATGPVPRAAIEDAVRSAGDYTVTGIEEGAGAHAEARPHASSADPEKPESLYPLFLIVGFIAGATALTTFVRGTGSVHDLMHDFMAGFFLVFSFFKLLDLRGFADAYQTYDVIAHRSRAWALAYPVVELALGVAYLVRWNLMITNIATAVLMAIGAIGVARALMRGSRIRCACLGTALNLPMTKVTLAEDLMMGMMAVAGLVWAG